MSEHFPGIPDQQAQQVVFESREAYIFIVTFTTLLIRSTESLPVVKSGDSSICREWRMATLTRASNSPVLKGLVI
jgi:hypothetical protein